MQMGDWKFKENESAKQALIEARVIQQEVIELCRENSSERLESERLVSADISYQLGKFLEEREGSVEESISLYNDCLQKNSEHQESLIAMARLHQNYGNSKDQCTSYCNRLLKIDPSNEEATFMSANLMLMEAKTEDAIQIYIQLLDKEPANFNTLSQLIELLRRAGRIQDIN